MNTETEIRRIMSNKGWNVRNVSYERPRSGFKCVEGGWVVEFETETDKDDYYNLFENIPMVGDAFVGSPGLILGMLGKDVIALVKTLPSNPELIPTKEP